MLAACFLSQAAGSIVHDSAVCLIATFKVHVGTRELVSSPFENFLFRCWMQGILVLVAPCKAVMSTPLGS